MSRQIVHARPRPGERKRSGRVDNYFNEAKRQGKGKKKQKTKRKINPRGWTCLDVKMQLTPKKREKVEQDEHIDND
jgi:hypothetical protein